MVNKPWLFSQNSSVIDVRQGNNYIASVNNYFHIWKYRFRRIYFIYFMRKHNRLFYLVSVFSINYINNWVLISTIQGCRGLKFCRTLNKQYVQNQKPWAQVPLSNVHEIPIDNCIFKLWISYLRARLGTVR